MKTITITESIFIERSPEVVWDFTQDYSKRTLWDKAVKEATIIKTDPRVVFMKSPGVRTEMVYKQDERPRQTSLAMTNTSSTTIAGGGGSWHYEFAGGVTKWTQTNTLILRDTFAARLLEPLITFMFKRNTRRAMRRAKRMIETS